MREAGGGSGGSVKRIRKSTKAPSGPAWKPVISKEHGPGIRRGNTFTTITGKSYSLGGSKQKSTRSAISDFNKRTNRGK